MPADTITTIMTDRLGSLLRLLHLSSPSLPTGAFAYSQGLEWAVEAGWVRDAASLENWLQGLARGQLACTDVPILARMMAACGRGDLAELSRWCDRLLAMRETRELRDEERQRGIAMVAIIEGLSGPLSDAEKTILQRSQLAGFARAAEDWKIPVDAAAAGYLWSWLENQVIAGIKIIPLGQTRGHLILSRMDRAVKEAVFLGLSLSDGEIGASAPGLAIACSCHETQYTRLYRS